MRNILPSELQWLYVQVRPFLRWHAASIACFIVSIALALLQPLLLKWLIDRALPERDPVLLLYAVTLLFLAFEGRAVFTALGGFLTLHSTQRTAVDLRIRLMRHLDTLSAEYHDGIPVGARLYPFREPIDEIAYFGSDLFPSILRTVVTTALALSAMVVLDPKMTLAIVPPIPFFLIARHYYRRLLTENSDTVQRERTALDAFFQEHFCSVVQIQLLRSERRRERMARRLLLRVFTSQRKLAKTSVFFSVYTNLAIAIAASAVVGFGGARVLTGALTIGGLVAFYSYVTQLFEPLSGAMEIYSRALRTFSSVRQLQMAFQLGPTVKNCPEGFFSSDGVPLDLRFENVRFSYVRQDRLIHIPYLLIYEGERVAVVGPNGAGKSTFAKLAARLYDRTSGCVHAGGMDVRNIPLDHLRQMVSYLPQHPVLFDETLAANLRYAKPGATEEELANVIELVGLTRLLKGLPFGWDERIGPGGSLLSGGERQRVALARTLLNKPRILILDEATSSLDPATEQSILPRIDRLLPNSTLILLTHRLANLNWINRVLVFDDGLIVEDGPPDFLRTQNGRYAELLRATQDTGH